MVAEFRMMNSKDKYIRISERHQVLELDDDGNIWLVLTVLDLAADQNLKAPYRAQAINYTTGEVLAYEPDGLKKQSRLSLREVEVLNLIGTGKLSKEIADQLSISVHTVNTHRQRIIEKLDVGNTIEALNFATELGLIG
ncbi:MAG: response regulator transcription factor [Flavobacteriales bacterium]|nr:response regulator transcription factor [Flavobacteriales bacterium]